MIYGWLIFVLGDWKNIGKFWSKFQPKIWAKFWLVKLTNFWSTPKLKILPQFLGKILRPLFDLRSKWIERSQYQHFLSILYWHRSLIHFFIAIQNKNLLKNSYWKKPYIHPYTVLHPNCQIFCPKMCFCIDLVCFFDFFLFKILFLADILAVNKPYGISSVGYKQENAGVFKSERYTKKEFADFAENEEDLVKPSGSEVTLEHSLEYLSQRFDEQELNFCTGLKRLWKSAVVLIACLARIC